jgi:hypothetical protein
MLGITGSRNNLENDWDTPTVMRRLDPRIHLLEKNGLPGQARQ